MRSIADSVVPELRIITGPTGAGKSALALQLAQRHGARIIVADSRQIYRGFDIGTAKPTREEQGMVPHVGIDVADPTERWNAQRWADAAMHWLAEDAACGRPSIIVGGTGLWLRALVRPLAEEPAMDPTHRAEVRAGLAVLPTDELRRWVETLDPPRAHLGRAQLARAAEVALVSGSRLSDWYARAPVVPPRAARWLVVDPQDALDWQLDARRREMLARGWVDEVRALMTWVPADAPAWNACGYREIREAVQGTRSLDDALEAVRLSTRQYAKRQRTWLRHQMAEMGPVTRLDPRDATAEDAVEQWFTGDTK